ncbi:phosphatase PAP2 family protein [Anaerobacillus alkaliphilus]|nr:phosphatase PAP2 family protein [Anaerobacillus alkaliphilus]
MKHKSIWRFLTFLTLLILSFALLTYFVRNKHTTAFDELLLKKVKAMEAPFVTTIMKGFGFIGATLPVIVISIILLIILYRLHKNRSEVYLFIIVLLGSTAFNVLVKTLIKRKRPISDLIIESGYSYPSGHTVGAVSLYGIITFLFWRKLETTQGRVSLIFFSVIMIMIMGFSRIYLGVHYPTDILGAYLLSGIWLYLTIWIYQLIMERRANESTKTKE